MFDFIPEAFSHNASEETGNKREVTEHFLLPAPHFIVQSSLRPLRNVYDFVLI